jgi:RimJ/RimL family protein N-acetyltransferase
MQIGRRIVSTAVEHAFSNGVRRVNLQVFVPNNAAVNLYSSLGFVETGRELEAICIKGVYYDGLYMSLAR